jgi:hypothetical protein
MSTRSRIAVAQNDGSVKSIYCHWDGYPSHNGKMLMQHYNSKPLADALVAMGDMSSLDVDIDKSTFYTRDRGEKTPGITYANAFEFFEDLGSDWEEYTYLFKNDEWVCFVGENHSPLPIAKAVARDMAESD